MARRTKEPVQQYGGTTEQLATYAGKQREITVDTTKHTVVVQDGTTQGGHPLVKESMKIKGDTIIKVNGGAEADHSGDITLTADMTATAAALVSADANNGLTVGTDNKLFAKSPDASLIIRSGDKVLHSVDGKVAADFTLSYNNTTGKFTIYGSDGSTEVSSVTVPSSVSMVKSVTLVDEKPGEGGGAATPGQFLKVEFTLADGSDTVVYVDMADLVDIYTGTGAVSVTNKVISVGVGKGLTITDGKIVPDFANMISADAGNNLMLGTDGALYIPSDYGILD